MKKKVIRIFVGTVIALAIIVFISNIIMSLTKQNKTGKVVIWAKNEEYKYIQDVAEAYMENIKGVRITVNKYDDDYNDLENISKLDNSPDIICLDTEELNSLINKDVKLKDVDSLLSKNSSYFSKRMIQEVSSEGEKKAIPFTTSPLVMYLRQDMLKQYGYNYDDIKTWNDFINMGKDIYEKSEGKVKILNCVGDNYNSLISLLVMQGMEENSNEFIIKEYVDNMLNKLEENNILNKDKDGQYFVQISSIDGCYEIKNIKDECTWTANNPPSYIIGGNRFYLQEGTYLSIISHDNSDNDTVDDFVSYLINNKKIAKEHAFNKTFYSSFNAYISSKTEEEVNNFIDKSPYLVMSNIAIKAPSINDFNLYMKIKNEYIN